MAIDFERLVVERIILELRYSRGFLYWDNCGKIWNMIQDEWPDIKMVKVSPDKATFRIQDEGLELQFDYSKIHLSQFYPHSSLKVFKEVAAKAIPMIAGFLEIKSFSRVGNRIFYLLPQSDLAEAADTVRNTGFLNISEEKTKLFGDALEDPGIQFKIQTDDVGYRFGIQALSRELQIDFPKPIEVDSSKFLQNVVLIDVDYFTRKSVDLSVLDCGDLITQVQRRLKSNLTKFLS